MKADAKLTAKVKQMALREGVHLVGVASVDRFEDAPPGHRPRDFVPGAKSVISMATRILPSALQWDGFFAESQIVPPRLRKIEAQDNIYMRVGCDTLNALLALIALKVANQLQELGFRSLSFATPSYEGWLHEQRNEAGEALHASHEPFSHRHAAVKAGLGEFGLNNLLLTRKYGSAVRVNSIITEAELVPDPLVKQKICLGVKCSLCIKACSARIGALRPTDDVQNDQVWINTPASTSRDCELKQTAVENRVFCWGTCIKVCPVGDGIDRRKSKALLSSLRDGGVV